VTDILLPLRHARLIGSIRKASGRNYSIAVEDAVSVVDVPVLHYVESRSDSSLLLFLV